MNEVRMGAIRFEDRAELLDLAASTGLFSLEEAAGLLGSVIDGLADRSLPTGHTAFAATWEDGRIASWAYFAPDPYSEGVWNLWWIGVHPEFHRLGIATRMLRECERQVGENAGRVLIVETSDHEALGPARALYLKNGYGERGRVPDFYGPGDSKVIFSKSLRQSGAPKK